MEHVENVEDDDVVQLVDVELAQESVKKKPIDDSVKTNTLFDRLSSSKDEREEKNVKRKKDGVW